MTYVGLFFILFGIICLTFAIVIDIADIIEAKKKEAKKEDDIEFDWEAMAKDIRKWKEAYYRGQ